VAKQQPLYLTFIIVWVYPITIGWVYPKLTKLKERLGLNSVDLFSKGEIRPASGSIRKWCGL
jgi:hypothetical protein